MSPIIYIIRHGQAEHNLGERYYIPDPPLTPLGESQARALHEMFDHIPIELIVSSPLLRTMQTVILGLNYDQSPVIVHPKCQESNSFPCDCGQPTRTLRKLYEAYSFKLDLCVPPYPAKIDIYDPSMLDERTKQVRQWLRERKENVIVVVGHADFMRSILQLPNEPILNCESRLVHFNSEWDEEAKFEIDKTWTGKPELKISMQ
ncbi:putative phosphatase [Neolecta irregularis DAH-3]|uniref:Putative phosphatase n=1 Tax=Neolecta irregularis (strain DAH-3) TaxID=1198029 RepID=A0A1U7LQ61_NEOID|nr:putative phosphatase [Neolecta irregularis DAH-3]|eukprot:OLL24810.1 putative phosphatase [Neolecta irregularis DAH-3]